MGIWDDGRKLTEVTRGTLVTNAGLPPGTFTVMIKAVDTSGNESVTEATFDITVTNTNDVVKSEVQHPRWKGTLTDFIKHDVSGRLIPDSNDLANVGGFNTFDVFVPNPKATCTYETPEIDLGFDSLGIRVFGNLLAGLGPGETGKADPIFEIDFRNEGDVYDGFEPWSVGTIDARRIKAIAKILTATGVAFLEEFTVVVDLEERVESATGVVIAPGGSSIVFAERFHGVPGVQATADSALALFPVKSNVTALGFDANVFNSSGVDVGGTIDYQAIGV